MELKSLLFIAGTVLAVGVQAQVGTAQSEPLTAVIQPRLQAVQTKKCHGQRYAYYCHQP